MNEFIQSAKELIYRNGFDITITVFTEGTYDTSSGKVSKTENSTIVKSFPKIVKVNSFNYPSLIGKEVVEFMVVSEDIPIKPKATDKIIWDFKKYTVVSVIEHTANGESVIYKILTSKV